MKKIFLAAECAVIALSMSGCFNRGPQFENIDTAQSADPATVSVKDYKDDLNGLIGYFKALNYLPVQTEPTKMMSEVIGAKEGYRYIYTVNGSQTVIELYEYDPSSQDANAQRVINEIKKNGSFHLFDKEGVDKDVTYPAVLSDSGKFMMIYIDNSTDEANVARAETIKKALKVYPAAAKIETSDNTSKEGSTTTESSQASA